MEVSQMENLEGGRRFWGWQQNAGECVGGVYYYISTYYVLGIAVDTVREPSIAPCTNNSFY
ncbi:hypothetical protein [Flavobacterium sp.]|uniref:hypothetical protein n=1 Tax=Flavobacterium sp. TaxID=239 RepID=UPI0040480037